MRLVYGAGPSVSIHILVKDAIIDDERAILAWIGAIILDERAI
ncbi:hypothetical protein [Mesobacillus jeotgali]|nr:hypothetical protein [Mesobacillus jeotgali]